MMRIVVTGAAGFMGSWLTEALLQAGHTVHGIDDCSGGLVANISHLFERHRDTFTFDRSELAHDAQQVERKLTPFHPEVLFHLAANAREGASQFQPVEVTRRNLWAYLNILEPAIRLGIKRAVLFSSMARYGDQPPPFAESLPPRPVDVYGVNKVACEEITRILADVHEFHWVIIVPHNVLGPRQSLCDPYRNVAAIFMNRILRGEPLYIYGDGQQQRAFSYIEDSLPCYLRCLHNTLNREVVNIGGMAPITINQLAEAVIEEFPESPRPEIIHVPARPREVKLAWCTYDKSVSLLGYAERVGWREGIRRMAQWVKRMGPQPWKPDTLPLLNEKAPVTWRELCEQ